MFRKIMIAGFFTSLMLIGCGRGSVQTDSGYQKSVMDSPAVAVVNNKDVTTNDGTTSDWIVYQSMKNGLKIPFSFSHPAVWKPKDPISSHATALTYFYSNNNTLPSAYLYIISAPFGKDVKKELLELNNTSTEEVVIKKQKALRVVGTVSDAGGEEEYIPLGSKMARVIFSNVNGNRFEFGYVMTDENQGLFKRMIETISFE